MPPSNRKRKTGAETALDRIDCEIVRLLQNDARMSNKELAASVGLAPSSCLERVRRLIKRGVFRGFHADVDPKAMGIGLQAMMKVQLTQHAGRNFDAFLAHVLSLPEVVAVSQVAGVDDYLVHIAVRDSDHLRELVLDDVSTRPEVAHLETQLMFRHVRCQGLPLYVDASDHD